MPSHRTYSQALQVLQYLYRTRSTAYRFPKLPTEVTQQKSITIELFTDAAKTNLISQGGYYMMDTTLAQVMMLNYWPYIKKLKMQKHSVAIFIKLHIW